MDSNSPCKDLLFPHGPNLAQKRLYLVGTVLKFHPGKLILLVWHAVCYDCSVAIRDLEIAPGPIGYCPGVRSAKFFSCMEMAETELGP